MDKTCKSNDYHRVAIFGGESGARVRNTWVICREVRNNPEKSGLMPNVPTSKHFFVGKVGDRKA